MLTHVSESLCLVNICTRAHVLVEIGKGIGSNGSNVQYIEIVFNQQIIKVFTVWLLRHILQALVVHFWCWCWCCYMVPKPVCVCVCTRIADSRYPSLTGELRAKAADCGNQKSCYKHLLPFKHTLKHTHTLPSLSHSISDTHTKTHTYHFPTVIWLSELASSSQFHMLFHAQGNVSNMSRFQFSPLPTMPSPLGTDADSRGGDFTNSPRPCPHPRGNFSQTWLFLWSRFSLSSTCEQTLSPLKTELLGKTFFGKLPFTVIV